MCCSYLSGGLQPDDDLCRCAWLPLLLFFSPPVWFPPPRREVAVAAASAVTQENTRNAVECGKRLGQQVEIC